MSKNRGVELGAAQCLATFSTFWRFMPPTNYRVHRQNDGHGDEIGFHRQDNCCLFTAQTTISRLSVHIQFATEIEIITLAGQLQLKKNYEEQ